MRPFSDYRHQTVLIKPKLIAHLTDQNWRRNWSQLALQRHFQADLQIIIPNIQLLLPPSVNKHTLWMPHTRHTCIMLSFPPGNLPSHQIWKCIFINLSQNAENVHPSQKKTFQSFQQELKRDSYNYYHDHHQSPDLLLKIYQCVCIPRLVWGQSL